MIEGSNNNGDYFQQGGYLVQRNRHGDWYAYHTSKRGTKTLAGLGRISKSDAKKWFLEFLDD